MSGDELMPESTPSENPPTEVPDGFEYEGDLSKWPRVIGIFSLIYALLGLCCQLIGGVWFLISESLPAMMGGGAEIAAPVKIGGLASALLLFTAGLFMLFGAINLLQRRRNGVRLLRIWVCMRLTVVVLAIVYGYLTMSANVATQRAQHEQIAQMLAEQGQSGRSYEVPSEESLTTRAGVGLVIGAVAFSIYPLILGIWLSRRKITEEVERWP